MIASSFLYVRHGETPDNLAGILGGGEHDIELAPSGRDGAAALAPIIAARDDIDVIFCSPMLRTRQTAELLNAQAQKPIVVIDSLYEWLVGDCSGKEMSIYGEKFRSWTYDPPGGESREVFAARVVAAITECSRQKPDGRFLIVAHGGVWWALMSHLGLPPQPMANTTLYRVTNCTTHWETSTIMV